MHSLIWQFYVLSMDSNGKIWEYVDLFEKFIFVYEKKKYSFGIIECFDEMIKMKHSRDFILLELEKIGKDINEWVDGCSKMK